MLLVYRCVLDPDDDVDLYDIEVSDEHDVFFQQIVEKHRELFDEPPEEGDWLHSPSRQSLNSLAVPPASIDAIIQVIVDVWGVEGLDVDDTRYVELLDDIEIDARPDHKVPDQLRDK